MGASAPQVPVKFKKKSVNNFDKKQFSSATHTATHTGDKFCVFCDRKGHTIKSCRKFLKLTIPEHCGQLKAKSICTKCLKTFYYPHSYVSCIYTCEKCYGDHHSLICQSPEIHTGEYSFGNKNYTDKTFSFGLKAGKSPYVNKSKLDSYTLKSLSKQNKVVSRPVSTGTEVLTIFALTQAFTQRKDPSITVRLK